MTAVADAPTGGIDIGSPGLEPIQSWLWAKRNTVKVTYMSHGKRAPVNLVGRIVSVTSDVVTLLRDKTGEPVTLSRERIRGIVVMKEGDIAGRTRVHAIRALIRAARLIADPRHVGGNQAAAADQIAMVLEMMPALAKGDGDMAWIELKANGADFS